MYVHKNWSLFYVEVEMCFVELTTTRAPCFSKSPLTENQYA